jgi:hypothetical protein
MPCSDPLREKAAVTVIELAQTIGARVLLPGKAGSGEIARIYAGDRMSDLLEQAAADTLLVTRLSNPHLAHVAELMDVPGLCLVQGTTPEPGLLAAAAACGTALLVSPVSLEDTCSRLERCLRERKDA